MAKLSAQEYVEKHATRLKGSVQDITRGVNRVTESPGAAAARQVDLMVAKINQAHAEGRLQRSLENIDLGEWKDAMVKKGVGRIAQGVDAAMGKNVRTAQNLLSAVDGAVSEVNQTPRGDLETNIGRMTTFVRRMADSKGKIKG